MAIDDILAGQILGKLDSLNNRMDREDVQRDAFLKRDENTRTKLNDTLTSIQESNSACRSTLDAHTDEDDKTFERIDKDISKNDVKLWRFIYWAFGSVITVSLAAFTAWATS